MYKADSFGRAEISLWVRLFAACQYQHRRQASRRHALPA